MEKLKILFVDDERLIVDTLKTLFKRKYDVFTSINPIEAIETVKRETFDIVVSDQKMPQMTGSEFLSEVKALRPQTIRLLLTGYSEYEAIISSINEAEVFRFIKKPWQNEEVINIIKTAAMAAQEIKDLSRAELIGDATLPMIQVVAHEKNTSQEVNTTQEINNEGILVISKEKKLYELCKKINDNTYKFKGADFS